MKTEKEIELMRIQIEKNISDLQDRYIDCCTQLDYMRISDEIMRLRAQDSILEKVLK